jgi:hypothetical protein
MWMLRMLVRSPLLHRMSKLFHSRETVPDLGGSRISDLLRMRQALWLVVVTGAVLAAFALGWFLGTNSYQRLEPEREEITGTAAVNAVVDRIIRVESNGDPNAKNKRSSALGLGQFLNETWLDMIRSHRPDLARGRNETRSSSCGATRRSPARSRRASPSATLRC